MAGLKVFTTATAPVPWTRRDMDLSSIPLLKHDSGTFQRPRAGFSRVLPPSIAQRQARAGAVNSRGFARLAATMLGSQGGRRRLTEFVLIPLRESPEVVEPPSEGDITDSCIAAEQISARTVEPDIADVSGRAHLKLAVEQVV